MLNSKIQGMMRCVLAHHKETYLTHPELMGMVKRYFITISILIRIQGKGLLIEQLIFI